MKRKRRGGKKKVRRFKKDSFNFKKLLLLLLSFLLLIYLIYSVITLFGIKSVDPLSQSISSQRFLSDSEGDLEKTIFIIERGADDKRAISDVYVFLNNVRKSNSILIYIPGTMFFNGLEGDFGSPIPISSLRYAGDFLQEDRGVEYTLWQLNEILGFRADSYVCLTTEANEVMQQIYGDSTVVKEKYKEGYTVEEDFSLSDSLLKLHAISSHFSYPKSLFNSSKLKEVHERIYSNLSFPKVLSKSASFKTIVNSSETYVMDLSWSKYSTEEFSDQGGPIATINIAEYDKALRRRLVDVIDRDLEKERVRIEVYNGSGGEGKAGIYARKILNNGCDVVRFGNAPDPLEKTKVFISDKNEFGASLTVVEEVLFGRYEILEERPSFMTTGDIVILLGKEVLQLEIF
jgi:hypothetical protein